MSKRFICGLLFGITMASSVRAAVPLFDFEKDADLTAWKWQPRAVAKLERAARFATVGESAMVFTTRAKESGISSNSSSAPMEDSIPAQ